MSKKLTSNFKIKVLSNRLFSLMTKRNFQFPSVLMQLIGRFRFGKRSISQTNSRLTEMADPLEHATGIEKRELLLRESGCNDPWGISKPIKRGSGSIYDPTPIPSAFNRRLIGCICLGDRLPKWMWLEKGEPMRCECGHYFVLKTVPPV